MGNTDAETDTGDGVDDEGNDDIANDEDKNEETSNVLEGTSVGVGMTVAERVSVVDNSMLLLWYGTFEERVDELKDDVGDDDERAARVEDTEIDSSTNVDDGTWTIVGETSGVGETGTVGRVGIAGAVGRMVIGENVGETRGVGELG